jgi:hypothetical protein
MLLENTDGIIRLPDFLIIGAMRSGTTSLFNYLSEHPELFLVSMPGSKEPQFFSYFGESYSPHSPSIRANPWTLSDYIELSRSAGRKQLIGDVSTSYLYRYRQSIATIKKVYGSFASKLKIIAILRNPIERAWSIYMLKIQGGDWHQPVLDIAREFEKDCSQDNYYNFISSGMYYDQIKAYQEAFSEAKFFLFDELEAEPSTVVKQCLSHLNVVNAKVPRQVGTIYNYSGIPRNKFVTPLYDFLFKKNRIKSVLKTLIPLRIRYSMKRIIGSKVTKKGEIPTEVKKYLQPLFRENILRCLELFKNETQVKMMRRWVEYDP